MTTRRKNRAISTTRRWTAGALLASTLAVGGLGLHLADAYAATQSGTVIAVAAASPTTTATTATTATPSTTPTTPSSTSTTSSTSSSTSLGSSSSTTGSTTTKGS